MGELCYIRNTIVTEEAVVVNMRTSDEVRHWYNEQVKTIPITLAKKAEELARQAHRLRNEAIEEARNMMQDREEAEKLDHDHPVIPFETLISRKMEKKNMTWESACWDAIYTAIKTNEEVNERFGLNADGSLK